MKLRRSWVVLALFLLLALPVFARAQETPPTDTGETQMTEIQKSWSQVFTKIAELFGLLGAELYKIDLLRQGIALSDTSTTTTVARPPLECRVLDNDWAGTGKWQTSCRIEVVWPVEMDFVEFEVRFFDKDDFQIDSASEYTDLKIGVNKIHVTGITKSGWTHYDYVVD